MLSDLIREGMIIPELEYRKKEDVIREICRLFVEAGVVSDLEKFIESIQKREQIESTAIGDGIAIPHGRSETVKGLAVAFAGSKEGIDFESLDGKPVHLIFMIAAPNEVRKEYLQAVARIARLLKIKDLKRKLLEAKTREDVMAVIKEFDSRFPTRMEVETKEGRVVYKS
ncbi:MAG TPA: PTS sugar transporter subunit IIA [Candidatus Latescibacteria bacterium]|nr:PTS sugar transporter subunit IIA [Candidatus Latescibacterota bacterium]